MFPFIQVFFNDDFYISKTLFLAQDKYFAVPPSAYEICEEDFLLFENPFRLKTVQLTQL
jgi:hypothetical protein